jgi:hypothetical protein
MAERYAVTTGAMGSSDIQRREHCRGLVILFTQTATL